MSLRVIGEGIAGPIFTQVFSAGSSAGFEQAPFFLATVFSLVSLTVRGRSDSCVAYWVTKHPSMVAHRMYV